MKTLPLLLASMVLSGAARAALVTASFAQNKAVNWTQLEGVTAEQSTTGSGGLPARAIDGNTNSLWSGGSISHTSPTDPTAFWEVDLGESRTITDITLFNRSDCCSARLSNFSVLASDDPTFTSTVWSSGNQAAAVAGSANYPVAASARYVRVQRDGVSLDGTDVISLAEVEVNGAARFSYQNLATGSTASQSSTLNNVNLPTADKAIDGNLALAFGAGTTTHTDPTAEGAVFWETVLATTSGINEIALYNRGDCCPERLSNFRVSVFSGDTEVWGQNFFTEPADGFPSGVFSIQEDTGAFFATGDRVRVELIGGTSNAATSSKVLSLREVEIFGQPGQAAPHAITDLALVDSTVEFTWNSTVGRDYTLQWSIDLQTWNEINDNYPSAGATTSYRYAANLLDPVADPAVTPLIYFRVVENPLPPQL